MPGASRDYLMLTWRKVFFAAGKAKLRLSGMDISCGIWENLGNCVIS